MPFLRENHALHDGDHANCNHCHHQYKGYPLIPNAFGTFAFHLHPSLSNVATTLTLTPSMGFTTA